jgi:hypothetical protein
MAVNHLVWLKFAADVPAERVQAHLNALQGLRSQVPGVLELSLGPNFTERANGFTHGLVVTLSDKTALAGYAAHPRHVEVATALRRDAQILALDYEFHPAGPGRPVSAS